MPPKRSPRASTATKRAQPARRSPRGRQPGSRYTRLAVHLAYSRPAWHKAVGCLVIALGVAIVTVNYLDSGAVSVLPGGHQELYFVLGALVAGVGSWWLGLFDPPV